jgi:hypothetical protein
MNNKKDIILDENGKIFPNWIMHNFKTYILPEIIRKEGEDPCNEKLANELTTYQKALAKQEYEKLLSMKQTNK